MKTLFDDAHRTTLLARLGSVDASSRPRWGKMNVEQMLAHLVAAMQMANGALTAKSKRLPLRFFPLQQLVIYWMPWPKGSPTAPELLPSDSGTVENNRAELVRLVDAFAKRTGARTWPEHPAFGRLSERAWGVLTWRHIDHHLRQFGA